MQKYFLLFLLSVCEVYGLFGLTKNDKPATEYSPFKVTCPNVTSLVRPATGLSDREQKWVAKRHKVTDVNLKNFLISKGKLDFDVAEWYDKGNQSITIGLAFSGGGFRAMLCGAGQISALDNRTIGGFEKGLGGLLESTTYLAGLSGGNWLTGTLAMNDWMSVQDLLNNKSGLWDLEHSMFAPKGFHIDNVAVYKKIYDDVMGKKAAGYNVTITDAWARSLSRFFFPKSTDYGANHTWASLRDTQTFQDAQMPFPISVSDGRYPGSKIMNLNSTNFEFNPFELGSWDPSLASFTDVKYLGSNVNGGKPVGLNQCVNNYDNAGFVMGTLSTLFNEFLLRLDGVDISATIKKFVLKYLLRISNDQNDISVIRPNPFYNVPHQKVVGSNSIATSDTLYLVDGGEDEQNVPLGPLIQPYRHVDIAFAFDNSADTSGFPNGVSLISTYQRQFGVLGKKGVFPYVPDNNTFIARNFTKQPVFFGCDSKNLTTENSTAPLVVYIANRPYSFWSNTSTFKMKYSASEKLSMISNGFEVASSGNSTIDMQWPTCVSCAIIRREQERRGEEQSDQCKKCFERYCWDGKLAGATNVSHAYTSGLTNYTNGEALATTTTTPKSGFFLKLIHKVMGSYNN